MKLPNGHLAIVDLAKLRDYCLSQTHPPGRHKARVFLSTLELTSADAKELRECFLEAAKNSEAQAGRSIKYGTRYVVDFEIARSGKRAVVRSSRIVHNDDRPPHLTSAYVLLERGHDARS
jgi:hypothetical protein